MIRLHLVDTATDEDLGIYEVADESEAREFARADHPDREQTDLRFYPEINPPELQGDATADAEIAFVATVRRYIAQCRTTQTDEQIKSLIQSHYGNCVVQQAVSLDVPMPYLALLNSDMAKSVEYVAIRALGDAELRRIETWARNELRERRRPQDGYIGVGNTHLYRFVPADFMNFWERS